MVRFIGLSVLLLAALGCGGATGDLIGKITYKKKPLASGTVQALGSDGVPRPSLIGEDGSYLIKDIPVGSVQLLVDCPKPGEGVRMRKLDEKGPKFDSSKWFWIPEKYADFKTSELNFDVKKGENTFNIDLP